MKLSVLELPSEVVGDVVTTPFALVFHGVPESSREELLDRAQDFKEATGARAFLVFEDEIEVV